MKTNEQATDSALERAVVRSEAFLRSAPKPAILGAAAGLLVLAFVVRRANRRRRRLNGERGDTVLGVMVKSAVTAAIATIPKAYFIRLAKSALHHDSAPDSAITGSATPGNAEDWRMRPTIPEPHHV
jgi:hypothetical protein